MDLLAAAAQGDTHTISSLLNSKSIDINFQNKVNGWTALHWACKMNQIPAIKLLLAHGAKILLNFNNQSPIDVSKDPQTVGNILKSSIPNNRSMDLIQDLLMELSDSSLQKIYSKFNASCKQDLLNILKNL